MGAHNRYSYGCLLGLLVGDAVGAPLEFLRERDPGAVRSKIERAMNMGGGGALNVAPRQGTDDSELAIHLLRGLIRAETHHPHPRFGLPQEAIAREYMVWHGSAPFDMGKTCASAFRGAEDAVGMRANALRFNSESQANGALMRLAPLAIKAHGRVGTDQVVNLPRAKARLSHPHPVCQDANAIFGLALTSLMGDSESGAGASVTVEMQEQHRALLAIACVDKLIGGMHKDVQQWYADSAAMRLEDILCTANIGHVKHAFTLAFFFLRRCTHFEVALRQTCEKLGDTDTNAAIVGAMMGALHGVGDGNGSPAHMSRPVLAFDCDWSGTHAQQCTELWT